MFLGLNFERSILGVQLQQEMRLRSLLRFRVDGIDFDRRMMSARIDGGYCLDAPEHLPAGSTITRVDLDGDGYPAQHVVRRGIDG